LILLKNCAMVSGPMQHTRHQVPAFGQFFLKRQ
jgi:hypothetical protein